MAQRPAVRHRDTLTERQRRVIDLHKTLALLDHMEDLTYDEQLILYTEAGVDEAHIVRASQMTAESRAHAEQTRGRPLRDDHTFIEGFAASAHWARYITDSRAQHDVIDRADAEENARPPRGQKRQRRGAH